MVLQSTELLACLPDLGYRQAQHQDVESQRTRTTKASPVAKQINKTGRPGRETGSSKLVSLSVRWLRKGSKKNR